MDDFRKRDPKDVRVLVVGCTGYIGKFVTKELIKRGYNVVAFTREQAGIKGKMGKDDIKKVRTGEGAAALQPPRRGVSAPASQPASCTVSEQLGLSLTYSQEFPGAEIRLASRTGAHTRHT